MTIDEDLAQAGAECDDRFDALQPAMIVDFRRHGVTEDQLPEALAWAHGEYWRERCSLLERLRTVLTRLHP